MEREIIRVEPFDTNFEKWGAPVSVCTRAGNMVFLSGLPPFDPDTGELLQDAPFERQAERILEQMKTALEAAGSDLDHVLKCNVLCISAERLTQNFIGCGTAGNTTGKLRCLPCIRVSRCRCPKSTDCILCRFRK